MTVRCLVNGLRDAGTPGPDRGLGGRYLLCPDGYTGPVPEGGYIVYPVRTRNVIMLCRAFIDDGDPTACASGRTSPAGTAPACPGS
ncbi:DUF1254 domain-containing protein [Actinoplanes sp. NPDC000266]